MLDLEVTGHFCLHIGQNQAEGSREDNSDIGSGGREAERHHPYWVVVTIKGFTVCKASGRAPGTLLYAT